MRKSRLLKAEIIVLVGVAVLWAVNLKTHCVPRATAGALRQVVKVTPNSRYAHELLGHTYYGLGWSDEGDEAYGQAEVLTCRKAVESNPTDPNAHFNLADAYYQLGGLEAAIQAHEEVLRLDSACRDAYEHLADCYWELDQPEKSIETWKRAISCDPEWTWPHVDLAFAYHDLGRYEEAIAEWKYLIELEPETAVLRALLADTYLETSQYEEAIVVCEEGLQINPDHPKSHYNLGRAHLQMGNTDLARKEYEVLKTLDDELANDLLESLRNHRDIPSPPKQAPLVPNDSPSQDEASHLRALDVELSSLDSYAMQERGRIEMWYLDQVAELKAQLDKRLETLSDADKVAWLQSQQRANETWSMTTGHEYGSVYDGGYGAAYGYGSSFGTTHTFVKGNPAGEYAAFLAQIKNSKQATQQDFLKARHKLALLRQQKLNAVKAEIERRKSRLEREFSRNLAGDRTPMVDAIGIAPDGRFYAMIGDAFVYEGSMVQAYRVRQVRADSVEFEKDGEVWVQKIQ